MSRTTLLQERRMQTFQNVLGHWQARRLSALEAAEMLGMSERSFRRYRRRYEDDGLDGLFDRRLDKASARRVPADRIEWVLEQYRTRHVGWTVKHFHDHLRAHHGFAWSYTWTKTTLQRAGLVSKAPRRGAHRRRRPRKPCVGMMLHQDGSRHEWLAGQAACDLIATMDDATSEIYSAFLVEEERHRVHLPRAAAGVHRQGAAQQPLYRPRQPLLPHPRGRRQGRQGSTHPGRPRPPPARHRAHRCLFARGARPLRARLRHPPGPPRQGTGAGGDRNGRSRKPLHRRHLPARTTTAASPPRPSSKTAPSCPSNTPARSTTSSVAAQTARSPATTPCATKGASSRSPLPRPDTTTSRPRSGSTSIQTEPSPSSTGPDASPATTPTASPSKPQPGRPRETLRRDRPAPCGQVDSRAAPDHFPTGQTATTEADK